jgi:WD40 repeat protein
LVGNLDNFEEDVNSGTLATQRPYVPGSGDMMDIAEELKGHSKAVTRVVFSPDGQWLVSGSQDATIKL